MFFGFLNNLKIENYWNNIFIKKNIFVDLGTIYLALGSIAAYDTAPKYVLDSLLDAFKELTQYRIVFTFRAISKELPIAPNHIKFVKWAPQYDLLSHKNTILFITHGGLKR